MSIEQHKMVLSCYRPGKDDPTQPELAAALEALKTHPELAQWYADECAFDETFRETLAGIPAPAPKTLPVAPPSAPYWRRLAAAAAVAILIGGTALHFLNRDRGGKMAEKKDMLPTYTSVAWQELLDFRQAMAGFAASGPIRLDHMDGNLTALQEIMSSKGALTGDRLAVAFASVRPMGCKLFQWQGRSVALYCFINSQRQIIHAFLLPETELSEEGKAQLAERQVMYERETGGWIADHTAYLLVAAAPGTDIGPYLPSDLALLPTSYLPAAWNQSKL